MKYSNDLETNEAKATENGERELISLEQLTAFIGDNRDAITELTLDILNNIYSAGDCVKDIKTYLEDEK